MSDDPGDTCKDAGGDETVMLSDMTMDALLDLHAAVLAEIHARFEYVEQWRAFTIDDRRGKWWIADGHEVRYQHDDVPYTQEVMDDGQYCVDEIYTYRHLKQYVYRTDTHTMVLVDTHTDLNIFLAVFDNALEQKDDP